MGAIPAVVLIARPGTRKVPVRGLIGRRSAPEPSRIFLVHPNEVDEVFDTEVGERLDAVFRAF